jgi:hypothetical protein
MSKKYFYQSISFFVILSQLLLIACEEDFSEVAPTQSFKIPQATAKKPNQYILEIDTPGTAQKEVPEWISNPELGLMRRYVTENPSGIFNGNEIRIRSVLFEQQAGQWKLILSDTPLQNELDIIPRGNRIEIPLTGKPVSEYTETQGFGKSPAELRIQKSPGKSYLWEASSSHILELQEWNMSLFDSAQAAVQKAGTANGRFQVYFKNSQGIEGWASGKFEQALIRYVGDPSVTAKPSL